MRLGPWLANPEKTTFETERSQAPSLTGASHNRLIGYRLNTALIAA